jgi:hypothetical protein
MFEPTSLIGPLQGPPAVGFVAATVPGRFFSFKFLAPAWLGSRLERQQREAQGFPREMPSFQRKVRDTMFKRVAILMVAALMLALAGCDAGPNRFSKPSLSASLAQIVQLFSNPTKELK